MYQLKAADWQPKHFQWQVKDRVATITLNRPERKNPLTFESYAELRDTFQRLNYTEDVRVVVFTGATRDTSRGRAVVRLEYEAFEAMTGPEMGRIFARCRGEHGDPDGARPDRTLRMLCVHRTGVVGVGEPSVAIAVASPHRAAAFEACRFLIDELKRSLPIWKKEVYAGGEEWVGDRS